MNEFPRMKLNEVVKSLGLTSERLNTAPKLIKGLLLDLCGQHRREINVLVLALAEGFVERLAKSKYGSPQMRVATETRRFCEEFALTEEAASWGINSWAIALGIVDSNVTIFSPSTSDTPIPATVPQPNPNVPASAPVSMPGIPIIVDPSKPVVVVSRLGFGQYKRITDAIEAVDSGSMIIVKQGTYNESLTCHTNKHLHIHADDSGGPVIMGSRLLSFDGTVMMSGFVLQNQCTIDEGMIFFVKCRTGEIKLKARNALHAFFQDCELGAIEFQGSAYTRGGLQNSLALERCEISRHGIGIAVSGKFASVRMHKCRVHNCRTAISFKDQSKGWVTDCEITKSETGVEILSDSSVTFQSCKIADNAGDAVVLMGYGLARFESCQIINNGAIALDIGPGHVEINRCSVNNNGRVAAFVDAHSVGCLKECDLRNNKAPIAITPGAQVQQSNNLL